LICEGGIIHGEISTTGVQLAKHPLKKHYLPTVCIETLEVFEQMAQGMKAM